MLSHADPAPQLPAAQPSLKSQLDRSLQEHTSEARTAYASLGDSQSRDDPFHQNNSPARDTGEQKEPRLLTPKEQNQGNGETILVVDDENFITRMSSLVFTKNGYNVLTAAEGRAALALYLEHKSEIKLVLTDVMMPGMNGVDLTRALREISSELKIIACTGMATDILKTELLELGVEAILIKPYDIRELLRIVHHVIHAGCA